MDYRAGIWLIYAGVVLRVLVRPVSLPHTSLVVALFALYGLLLLVEPLLRARLAGGPPLPATGPVARVGGPGDAPAGRRRWPLVAYLLVQTGLIVVLFSIPPHLDFYAGLFVPLSLQAVLVFGRRLGFLCIALFPLAMFVPLTVDARGWPFALGMSLFAGGLCFLFGSYAGQVQEASAARSRHRRLLGDLQAAYHQLQGYAVQVEGLAAEQERSRLARELHDSVTQTVFSMNLTVQSARLLLEKDRTRVAAQLGRLEELAAGAMGEIQILVSQLRPSSVVPLLADGLPAVLRRLAADRQQRDGLQVTLELGAEQALPQEVASALYAIAQEALTNVAKHAGPCRVTIHLDLTAAPAVLDIEDDGLGFDPRTAAGRPGHFGLAGMAEWARDIGWTLAVDSRPGCGTRVRVSGRLPGGDR